MAISKLYVGNIIYSATDTQLRELFSSHGEVKEVTIIPGKGFGFVEMATPEEAEKAREALNGTQWEGRTIRVDEARPQAPREERGRTHFGGRSGGYRSGGGGYGRDSERGRSSRGGRGRSF